MVWVKFQERSQFWKGLCGLSLVIKSSQYPFAFENSPILAFGFFCICLWVSCWGPSICPTITWSGLLEWFKTSNNDAFGNFPILFLGLYRCVLWFSGWNSLICPTSHERERQTQFELQFQLRKLIFFCFWVFLEQIMAYLMVTSGAAVLEILYLAYKGDRGVSWSEACSAYGRFCSRVNLALALHALALCCFLVLAVISAYRVFSMFEPPVSSKEVEEERASWLLKWVFFLGTSKKQYDDDDEFM